MILRSELLNLWLFAQATAKALLMTGIGPFFLFAWVRSKGARFWCPIKRGQAYRVEGYHTGDFVGVIEALNWDTARIRVTDPMRPAPRVHDRCSFPECVRKDLHAGDHEFVRVRDGALLEIEWRAAQWVPVNQSSGGEQLAMQNGSRPTTSSRATSSPRKVRRYA